MKPKAACVKKGGRKCCLDSMPEVREAVEQIVADHTAGDPMRNGVKWTYLSVTEITTNLMDADIFLHDQTVGNVLKQLGYGRRKAEKTMTMGHFPDRDEQFGIIASLKEQYRRSGQPMFSIDSKKKEFVGNFYRKGRLWSTANQQTYDHDFQSFGDGRVVPHGIYDLHRNTGHITLGLRGCLQSRDCVRK